MGDGVPMMVCVEMTQSVHGLTPDVPPLRGVRISRGLSLRDVARRAEIDPGHLSRVERGERQLSIEALGRLARVLGLAELSKLLQPYEGRRSA
jgi:transcriptional regulator with XRE-family HTH domain